MSTLGKEWLPEDSGSAVWDGVKLPVLAHMVADRK